MMVKRRFMNLAADEVIQGTHSLKMAYMWEHLDKELLYICICLCEMYLFYLVSWSFS